MHDQLTVPAYPVREVARLLAIRQQRARRWLHGYWYEYRGEKRHSPPLRAGNVDEASFLDLMELQYANAFIEGGFSIHQVRAALEEARRVLGQQHPFANRLIYVSPNDIFVRLQSQGDDELRSLLNKGQTGILPVILDLSRRVVFGDDGYITKWYPRGTDAGVVVDPSNLGGRPRIEGTRLSTSDIVELWRAADCKVDVIADSYQLKPDQVRAAIDFENAAAAAA